MGHWTNSTQQVLAEASGAPTTIDFDEVIIPGSQTALVSGVYAFDYNVNCFKPSGEPGPSRLSATIGVKRAGQAGIDIIRSSRCLAEIDTGSEENLAHAGQIMLDIGDQVTVRVNVDNNSQNGQGLQIRSRQGMGSLSLDLMGVAPSGNLSSDSFPPIGVRTVGGTHWREDLREMFVWNGTDWLGEVKSSAAGRQGNQNNNVYLRLINGMQMSATLGIYMSDDIVIEHFCWAMEGNTGGEFQIERNGVTVGTVNTSGAKSGGATPNMNFQGGGVLAIRWTNASTVTSPQVSFHYRRRISG